jgi:uncharacterized protein YndB with AHSA1/START domain
MSAYGAVLESGAVRFERILPAPVERVWIYLTDSEKRGTWFASGAFDLRVGGETNLLFQHARITPEAPPEQFREMNEKGILSKGTITRCEPPHALAFTWEGDGNPPSEVTFELTPKDGKTLLVLTHRKLADAAAMKDVSGGWHLHLDLLMDQLAGNPPRGFWSRLAAVEAEYAGRIGEQS